MDDENEEITPDSESDEGDSTDQQIQAELDDSTTTNPYQPGTMGQYVDETAPGQIDKTIQGELNSSPLTAPQAPQAGQPAPQLTSVGGGISTSVEHHGIAGGPGTVKGLYDAAETKANARDAQDNAYYDKQIGQLNSDFDAEDKARQSKVASTKQYWDDIANERQNEINHLTAFSDHIERIQNDGLKVRAESIAQYKEQLAGVRALVAQDGNPLHTLNNAEKLGLGMASFAQGFLKARYGIDINVNDQIDRWVQQSMQAHQNKIANARAGANDTLNLYNIARQNSQDDIEAVMRTKGMYLEIASAATQASAARFNSDTAQADADVASAELKTKRDEIVNQIGEQRMNRHNQNHIQAATEAYQQGNLMIETRKEAAAERHNARMEAIAAAKAPPAQANPLLIQDPSQVKTVKNADGTEKVVSGGKFVAQIDPNLPRSLQATVYKRAVDAQQMFDGLHGNLARLQKMTDNLKARGPDWYKRMSSGDWREYNALRELTVGELQKFMTGAQANDAEAQRYLNALQGNQWLQEGNNDNLLGNVQGWARRHFESALRIPGVIPLKGESYADPVQVDPTGAATETIHDSRTPPTESLHDQIVKKALNPTYTNTPGGSSWSAQEKLVPASKPWVAQMGDEGVKGHMPESASAVNAAVAAVLAPDAVRNNKEYSNAPKDPARIRQEGIETLSYLASTNDRDKKLGLNPMVRRYAYKWLTDIQKDEKAAREKFIDTRGE